MKNKKSILAIAFLSMVLFSCTKMENTHEEYIKEGPIKYTGRIKSAQVHSGKNRAIIQGLKTIDPDAKNIKVKWEFEGVVDSLISTIDAVQDGEYIKIELNGLKEGEYTFYIITSD